MVRAEQYLRSDQFGIHDVRGNSTVPPSSFCRVLSIGVRAIRNENVNAFHRFVYRHHFFIDKNLIFVVSLVTRFVYVVEGLMVAGEKTDFS